MGFFYFVGSCGAENWDYQGLNVDLLEIIGRGYVIDHCVSFFNKQAKEERYRNYIADTLKLMNENIAKLVGGSYYKMRYAEQCEQKKEPEKSGDEIARDIIRRAKLKLKG